MVIGVFWLRLSVDSIKAIGLRIWCVAVLLGVTIWSDVAYGADEAKAPPVAKDGVIDLTGWDFEKDGIVELRGEWRFVWGDFVDVLPSDQLKDSYKGMIQVPSYWNAQPSYENPDIMLSEKGYGTYILEIKLSSESIEQVKKFAFTYNHLSSNAQIWDSEASMRFTEIDQGIPSEKSSGEVPFWNQQLTSFSLNPQQSSLLVIIKVSNFNTPWGGFWRAPVLGNSNQLKNQELLSLVNSAFLIGILCIIALYHLVLYGQRRDDKTTIAFSFFCLAVMLRELITSHLIEKFGFGNSVTGYNLFQTFEYISMPLLITSCGIFIKTMVPSSLFNLVMKIWFIGLGIILTFLPVVTSTLIFHRFLPIYQLHFFGALLISLLHLGLFSFRKNRVAQWMLSAFIVLLTGTINDILNAMLIIDTGVYGPYAVLAFVLMQSAIISGKFSQAFSDVKHLVSKLKEQERARTLFFHNTSHELRTPLNGIIGFLDLVRQKRYGDLTTQASNQIGKALHLAESLKLQINTILDLAKSKRGDLKQNIQKLSLAELKSEADNLAEGLQLRQADLGYQSSLNAEDDAFIGDQEKIFTIIRNLLGNGFKFKDPQRSNQVKLLMTVSNQKLTIRVEDTGVGIPETAQEKIFEEFGQVDGDARRSYEGTGLGLSMVHNLIKLMDGEILCDSEPGKGSIFTAVIPEQPEESITVTQQEADPTTDIHTDNQLEQLSEPTQPEILIEHEASQDWSVFVIDDSEINCEVIAETLKVDGYQLRYALSGTIGITQMREEKPDLLLLDMMMPEMSGEDVLNAMKEDPLLQEIPIILITARASEEDRIFGLNIGADDYLPKPIVANELRLRVRNMIDRHRLLREIENTTSKDKIVQLGELFGELSHELKNILEGAGWLKEITTRDSELTLATVALSEANQRSLVEGMMVRSWDDNQRQRLMQMEKGPDDDFKPIRNRLRSKLAGTKITMDRLKSIWHEILEQKADKLEYLDSQFRIFGQHQDLMQMMNQCQDLTKNVLSYTRDDQGQNHAQLNERFQVVSSIIQAKNRGIGARWQVEMGQIRVGMKPNALTQVLLNLGVNALDAVADLANEDKWIATVATISIDKVHIDWSNGGPPIPTAVQNKLFKRGFSTKGDGGSGIGLYVSQRLVREAGGELLCIDSSDHPSFRIVLPLVSENDLAAA